MHSLIQVSESGQDKPSCVFQPHSCKTLAFVLHQMNRFALPEYIINVMYNLTIQKSIVTSVRSENISKISVVGYNNAFINFECAGTHIYIMRQVNVDLQWSWRGLGFAWVGQTTEDNSIPLIDMTSFSIEILDCKFISVSLYCECAQTLSSMIMFLVMVFLVL